MVETEFPKLLQEFQEAALDLNVKSNSINSTISFCEQRIVDANAGIEYWSNRELERGAPVTDEKGVESCRASRLGFAKVGGQWHLAVQSVFKQRCSEDIGGGQYEEYWRIRETEEPTMLSQGSRDLRITALEELPDLIRQLTTKALQAIKTIERAQKLVN
jgi:hypothetical protein